MIRKKISYSNNLLAVTIYHLSINIRTVIISSSLIPSNHSHLLGSWVSNMMVVCFVCTCMFIMKSKLIHFWYQSSFINWLTHWMNVNCAHMCVGYVVNHDPISLSLNYLRMRSFVINLICSTKCDMREREYNDPHTLSLVLLLFAWLVEISLWNHLL
mgnify:CR=1 FL=1